MPLPYSEVEDEEYLMRKTALELGMEITILTIKINKYRKFYETLKELTDQEKLFRCELHNLILELEHEKMSLQLRLRDVPIFENESNLL